MAFGDLAATALLALADYKNWAGGLSTASTNEDDILGELINTSTWMVEDYCRRHFLTRTNTDEYLDGEDGYEVRTRYRPINSVTSIAEKSTGATTFTTVDSGDYTILGHWGRVGIIKRTTGAWIPGTANIKTTYVSGDQATAAAALTGVPSVVHVCRQVVKRLRGDIKETDRLGITSVSMEGQTVNFRPQELTPLEKRLLDPYRFVAVGASL